MELTPHAIAAATFDTVRKGWDPAEVRAYLAEVAAQLEATQQQATAMEARARAAIAKVQELQAQSGGAPTADTTPPGGGAAATPSQDDSDTISRTLLLAQRTADTTVAEARAEAEALTTAARTEATTVVEEARAAAAAMLDQARTEARKAKEDELVAAEGEVQALIARRDFLVGDVEILEEHVGAQRDRVRDVIAALQELVDRPEGGLAEARMPLLSASADEELTTARADQGTGAGEGAGESPT